MDNTCSGDNVSGKIVASSAYEGKAVNPDAFKALDKSGQDQFVNFTNDINAGAFHASKPSTPAQQASYQAAQQSLNNIGGGRGNSNPPGGGSGNGGSSGGGNAAFHGGSGGNFGKAAISSAYTFVNEYRNPSGMFGENFVHPLVDFLTNHFEAHHDNLNDPSVRAAYDRGVAQVFQQMDAAVNGASQGNLMGSQIHPVNFNTELMLAYKRFRNYYMEGGEFYNKQNDMGMLEQAISNVTTNTIKSSPNVILGNVAEAAIKFPSLYPKEMFPALAEAMKYGLWTKVPELEAKGVYGMHIDGPHTLKQSSTGAVDQIPIIGRSWNGLMGLTDVPFKNWAYRIGEMRPEGGLFTVQQATFQNRFGDTPSAYYTSGSKAAVRVLGYTINTYKLLTHMIMQFPRNPLPLLTYGVMASAVGGGFTAAVPGTLVNLLSALNPNAKEWFKDHSGPLTQMVQANDITRVGIPFSIANRQLKNGLQLLGKATSDFQNGDAKSGILNTADGMMTFLPLTTQGLGGDINLQKILKMAHKWADGEVTTGDLPIETLYKLMPAARPGYEPPTH